MSGTVHEPAASSTLHITLHQYAQLDHRCCAHVNLTACRCPWGKGGAHSPLKPACAIFQDNSNYSCPRGHPEMGSLAGSWKSSDSLTNVFTNVYSCCTTLSAAGLRCNSLCKLRKTSHHQRQLDHMLRQKRYTFKHGNHQL